LDCASKRRTPPFASYLSCAPIACPSSVPSPTPASSSASSTEDPPSRATAPTLKSEYKSHATRSTASTNSLGVRAWSGLSMPSCVSRSQPAVSDSETEAGYSCSLEVEVPYCSAEELPNRLDPLPARSMRRRAFAPFLGLRGPDVTASARCLAVSRVCCKPLRPSGVPPDLSPRNPLPCRFSSCLETRSYTIDCSTWARIDSNDAATPSGRFEIANITSARDPESSCAIVPLTFPVLPLPITRQSLSSRRNCDDDIDFHWLPPPAYSLYTPRSSPEY